MNQKIDALGNALQGIPLVRERGSEGYTKKMLAHRIDQLGFSNFLIMGAGDERNRVDRETSVKEDLFEAIIGAVAVDSGWDFEEIQSAVELMLDPDTELDGDPDDNYVQLVQTWTGKNCHETPKYSFGKTYYTSWPVQFFDDQPIKCVYESDRVRNSNQFPICCYMKIANDLPEFWGTGMSKSDARRNACELAYRYLDEHDLLLTIRDEIEHPSKKDAINQLETLARRGYFSLPAYEFLEKHDEDGSPYWKAECHIAEYETYFWAQSSSKKEAKKDAAFEMLKFVLK